MNYFELCIHFVTDFTFLNIPLKHLYISEVVRVDKQCILVNYIFYFHILDVILIRVHVMLSLCIEMECSDWFIYYFLTSKDPTFLLHLETPIF